VDSGKKLKGRVAIVTGGGGGIGRAIARCLAEAGAAVVVAGRSVHHLTETVQLIEQAGGQALALGTDVTDRQAVEALAHTTQDRLGSVDLLVNNAAQLTIAPIWEADPDEWWQCVTVNLRGAFLCTRAVLPGMISRGRGRIVNVISSQAYKDQPYLSAYSSSKAGLIRFTGSLAAETKALGLAAFALYPGQVDTQMQEYVAQVPSPEWRRWRDSGPAPRFIPPERVGRLVEALALGKADALSGRVIDVNADLEELILHAEEIVEHDRLTLRLQT
jgi:3-oxoacyl-[acyl-carrier protein] reductase